MPRSRNGAMSRSSGPVRVTLFTPVKGLVTRVAVTPLATAHGWIT